MLSVMPVLYDIALVLTVIGVIFVAFQKPSHDQKMLLQILYVCGITALGYFFKAHATTLEGLVIGQKLIYSGGCFCYYLMLVFYFNYCGVLLKRWMNISIIIINSFIAIVGFTFDSNTLLYKSFSLQKIDGVLTLWKEYGPVHTLYVVEVGVCVVAMISVAITYRLKNGRAAFGKMIRLLIVVLGPTVGYILDKIVEIPYDFVPVGLTFAILLILYLVYFEKIYDVSDLAREYAFKYMESAYIVVDEKNRYRGSSPLARTLFPEILTFSRNKKVEENSPRIRAILDGETTEYLYAEKVYKPSVVDIEENNHFLGKLIWMSDITTYKEHLQLVEKYQSELEEQVREKTREAEERRMKVEQTALQMVKTLANTIDAKDRYTNGHSSRVSEYAVILAKELGWNEERVENLRYQGLLHDIGKIGIPDSILNKPSKLNDKEYQAIKQHTIMGAKVLHDTSSIPGAESAARYHHERYDGKGYPDGIGGESIPIEARIIGIADAYDAMSSNRVYRKSLSRDMIREELVKGSGTQFDPDLVKIFIRLFDEDRLDISDKEGQSNFFYKAVEESFYENSKIKLEDLLKLIRGSGESGGALEVNYGDFTELYEYFGNIKQRYDHEFTACLVSVEARKGSELSTSELEQAMVALRRIVNKAIRGVDICTQLSTTQYLVVLLDAGAYTKSIMRRVDGGFEAEQINKKVRLTYEISNI